AATGGGILYEPNTGERLAQAMEPLLLDAQAARELGARGRAGMLKAFDISHTAGEVIRVLEQVVRR
ncbi:MAG: glycosyltransferase WbuB, partial [Phycisphaerales bacterium]